MKTISEALRQLLGAQGRTGRESCPQWPPDAFAVAATLTERTGAYARRRPESWSSSVNRTDVCSDASEWRKDLTLPKRVASAWRTIVSMRTLVQAARDDRWIQAVHYLLACADEASAGIGFTRDSARASNAIERVYDAVWLPALRDSSHSQHALRRETLCLAVSPEVACVQPKARTSQVGCTLRTLSHHLSLLPPASIVRTCWFPLDPHPRRTTGIREPLNLLLLPFPYRIDGSCFHSASVPENQKLAAGECNSAYFGIAQKWLPDGEELQSFLENVLSVAEKTVNRVDGVILPELALDVRTALDVAATMKRRGVEIFVTGVMPERRNALFAHFDHGRNSWTQAKHHRWRLDGRQVRRYQLGHALDPATRWWEDIDLGEIDAIGDKSREGTRAVHFVEVRPGAVACALICEDLARHDPVHPVVRAVGPTLVIALLMDGPQLAKRWPGQYASVLADDPGSSVLTLTSLGMLRRSVLPGEPDPRTIALWKDASGEARELELPRKAHGLLLSLNGAKTEETTLDGRTDSGQTVNYSLGAVHAVTASARFRWAQ